MKIYIKSQNMPEYFLRLKIKYSSYQCKYLHHHHQSHHYRPILLTYTMFVLSYLYPLILCLIYSPMLSVSWHPLTKKIAPQCVVDQVDIFYSSTSTFYAIAILVTRNKSKIFFMGRSTNCHPSKRSPKKC